MGSMNPGNRICSEQASNPSFVDEKELRGRREADRLVPIPTGPVLAGVSWEIR